MSAKIPTPWRPTAATIAGYLNVSLLPGFTPDYGDVFEILTAGSPIVGTFAGLPQGALVGNFAGTDIYIDYTAEGGTRSSTSREPPRRL